MHVPTLWKSALLQVVIISVLMGILHLALPKDFFEDWGWFTGPVAWLGTSAVVGSILKLPIPQVLIGAVLAGLVSAVFVVLGLHLVGLVLAIPLFAVWCARLHDDPDLPMEAI